MAASAHALRNETLTAAGMPFVLASGSDSLIATGVRDQLSQTVLADVSSALPAYFAADAEGPGLVVGALPFDPNRAAFLFQPEHYQRHPGGSSAVLMAELPGQAPSRVEVPRVEARPSAADYAQSVRRALDMIAADGGTRVRKIVLARSLVVESSQDFSVPGILQRLAADPDVNVFCVPLPGRTLIGATPELLVAKTGTGVLSHPLAGSARRFVDATEDAAAARDLLASDKNRREHAAVVEAILDVLAPYCRQLRAPEAPELVSTATLWHLASRIEGKLRDPSVSSLELATKLHPTPAVCGLPRAAAAEAIRVLEPFDRDFYSGAVGWCDRSGDGRWYVTIRCAEIQGSTARLYAGAGIVAGSDPLEEVAETSAKFMALLGALGIETPDAGY